MAGNRQKAESFLLKYIKKLSPKSQSVEIYKRLFASMSDKDFDVFINDLESGKKHLSIVEPNFSDAGSSVANNLKIADELGHNFFEKLWIEGDGDTPTYLTPVEYMVVDLPLKRASQLLTKKISVPDHNKVIDSITGQPTGESKGAKISYPELQLAAAMDLESTMLELMKYRGGDRGGGIAYNNMASKLGTVNLEALSSSATGVESTKTLRTFLTSAMLQNNL